VAGREHLLIREAQPGLQKLRPEDLVDDPGIRSDQPPDRLGEAECAPDVEANLG
jgi:hypothetical protein